MLGVLIPNRRMSDLVRKPNGDVMKLQIKVNPETNVIEDSSNSRHLVVGSHVKFVIGYRMGSRKVNRRCRKTPEHRDRGRSF